MIQVTPNKVVPGFTKTKGKSFICFLMALEGFPGPLGKVRVASRLPE
jgi:hypothetical protein